MKAIFNKKNNANNQALYNILSTIVLSGISFLTVPIFTRMLGAEQYGLYSVFHSWVVIVMCFVALECRSGLGTGMYEFNKEYPQYKSSSLFMGFIFAVVIIFLAILFREKLAIYIGFPAEIVVLIMFTALSYHIVEFQKNACCYEKKAKINFIISTVIAISTVLLSILFLHYSMFKELYIARAFGDAIPYCLAAVIIVGYNLIKVPPKIDMRYWRFCFTMGFPIIFHGLAQDVLKQSDRIMMQQMGYAGVEVGIYSFFCTYTAIVNVVLTALNATWCPFYYDDLNDRAYDRLKNKCSNYFELFTIVAIVFLLLSREVCYFFANDEYWTGMDVIPLLILSIYFIFMYQFPVNFEFFNKKTKIIAMGTFSAAAINIILNFIFIPHYGMYGAALATAISYGMLFLAHFVIANRIKEMKFHIKIHEYVPGLIGVGVFTALFYIFKELVLLRWIIGLFLCIAELYRMVKRKSIF